MRVELFDFELPEALIALRPARPRDSARLLHVPAEGEFEDRVVRDCAALFRRGDLMVFNDTRVVPARLKGVRLRDEGRVPGVAVSLNLIERVDADKWRALAKPGKRLREGDTLHFKPPLPLEGGGAGVGVKQGWG
jgi:S-adenosylmethionine:tRNA ribosyltransferase-isomerase